MTLFESLFSADAVRQSHLFSSENKFARSRKGHTFEEESISLGKYLPRRERRATLRDTRSAKESTKPIAESFSTSHLEPPRKKSRSDNVERPVKPVEPSSNVEEQVHEQRVEGQEILVNKGLPKQTKTLKDEAEQLSRTIFVGNLHANTKGKTLKALFARCGQVESARLRSVPLRLDKKLPRRAAILSNSVSLEMGPAKGYVVFKEEDAVENALLLNMQEVEGHHIRVDRASHSSKPGHSAGPSADYDRSCSIFIGNLPFDATDEEVIRLFSDDSTEDTQVKAVRIVRDSATNIGKGFGYVLFSDKNAARMALAKDSFKLQNRPLRVSRVVKMKAKASSEKPGKYSGALGAVGRLSRKQGQSTAALPSAAWQGVRTKGKGKTAKSTTAEAAPQGPAAQKKQASKADDRGRKVKRPAVAARKARLLGLPIPAAAKKKQKREKARK